MFRRSIHKSIDFSVIVVAIQASSFNPDDPRMSQSMRNWPKRYDHALLNRIWGENMFKIANLIKTKKQREVEKKIKKAQKKIGKLINNLFK
jgi:hypothetical protein